MKLITAALRVAQILFGAVVLALSVSLIKGQHLGSAPAVQTYGAFTGAFSLVMGDVALVAVFVQAIPMVAVLLADALAATFYLVGGIVIVVKLRGISCSGNDRLNLAKMFFNPLLNGGCVGKGKNLNCWYYLPDRSDKLHSRCKMNEADAAFMFISFVFILGAAVFTFLNSRRR
ncbi:hypothetical protein GQ43DRAFT_375595 [Delitschia confertaspora ATCC 74209]|uniref:MARVEL domain-containing protein n=1 Tax=Delitschia confertaspora ATCC 74209 TaxID=1513339 RepID=A0A9P4JHW2_9PLEO|nr:hypothetical protein GQ43DRAFT_375595 [Delitschia confertaspora ATCC 74209]